MRATITTATASAVLLAVGLALGTAWAADAPITIDHPWLRATPNKAPVAGGYATITNHGSAPDTLVSASLPMAAEGQVHTMSMKNGVMQMRRLEGGLTIAPGATLVLKPGGDHLMFVKPSAPLKEGESVHGSLTFKGAGTIAVTFAVGGMAAKSAPGTQPAAGSGMEGMDHMHMDHMHMH